MRTLVGVVVVAGMLALSGCVDGDPIPTLPPAPSSTPLFASEEEALAAAEEAYRAYLEIWHLVTSEGGIEPERIESVATREFLDSALDDFATFRAEGWRTVGVGAVERITLQYADLSTDVAQDVLAAYVCVDYSSVDVVDESGASVVAADRPDLQAFEVYFDALGGGLLIPSGREVWDVTDACGLSQ